jgi:pyrimidine deaminase RibD-like protein
MNIAKDVAARSTCPRASVGVVIVKDNHILSAGYNGAPPGESHCIEVGCLMINNHCERTIHAETNAVVQAAKFGVNINSSTLYCWSERGDNGEPFEGTLGGPVANCIKCSQVMKAAGIVRVVNK